MDTDNTIMFDFEKDVAETENRIQKIQTSDNAESAQAIAEVRHLKKRLERQLKVAYGRLTPWQKLQVARHPMRPHCLDYVKALIDDFVPLSGDRMFADDEAMIAGIGKLGEHKVAILGLEKGNTLETRVQHNFGMARPEGYRKAIRIMDLANKFNLPIITFVDTSGAYPGVDAEERGQAEAIAKAIEKSLQVEVPIVAVVIGEGG